jgi:hypothetical protein
VDGTALYQVDISLQHVSKNDGTSLAKTLVPAMSKLRLGTAITGTGLRGDQSPISDAVAVYRLARKLDQCNAAEAADSLKDVLADLTVDPFCIVLAWLVIVGAFQKIKYEPTGELLNGAPQYMTVDIDVTRLPNLKEQIQSIFTAQPANVPREYRGRPLLPAKSAGWHPEMSYKSLAEDLQLLSGVLGVKPGYTGCQSFRKMLTTATALNPNMDKSDIAFLVGHKKYHETTLTHYVDRAATFDTLAALRGEKPKVLHDSAIGAAGSRVPTLHHKDIMAQAKQQVAGLPHVQAMDSCLQSALKGGNASIISHLRKKKDAVVLIETRRVEAHLMKAKYAELSETNMFGPASVREGGMHWVEARDFSSLDRRGFVTRLAMHGLGFADMDGNVLTKRESNFTFPWQLTPSTRDKLRQFGPSPKAVRIMELKAMGLVDDF